MEEYFYTIIDTDKIQAYIFETGKLKEIVGASNLINEVTNGTVLKNFGKGNYDFDKKDWIKKDDKIISIFEDGSLGWELIYASGGNIKVIFRDDKKADDFINAVKKKFYEETESASFTYHIERFKYVKSEDINNAMDKSETELRKKKRYKEKPFIILSSPYFKKCNSCNRRPSVEKIHEEYLCMSCYKKRDYVEKKKSDFLYLKDRFFEKILDKHDSFNFEDIEFPKEIKEIGKKDDRNYVALIVADGINFGEKLKEIAKKYKGSEYIKELRNFSKTINEAFEEALIESVIPDKLDEYEVSDKNLILPFRPILIGGDDITFIIPAKGCVDVVKNFIKKFEKETETKNYNCKLSCGIAVVKQNFPFIAGYELAGNLLKNAKKKSYELSDKGKNFSSFIDFHILTSSSIQDRDKEYSYKLNDTNFKLTDRPYSLKDLDTLIKNTESLKKIIPARSKRKRSRELMRMGEYKSRLGISDILYKLEKGNRDKFLELLHEGKLWKNQTQNDGTEVLVNNLIDMIELEDII